VAEAGCQYKNMATLTPYTTPAKPREQNFGMKSEYWLPYSKEEHPDYINLEDPRPYATPKNNLSVNFPRQTAEQIAETATRWGVDPNLAIAASWKETMGGQKARDARTPAWHKFIGYINPMQANAAIREEYPVVRENVDKQIIDYRSKLKEWIDNGGGDEQVANELFRDFESKMQRTGGIDAGVAKLYDVKKRYPDDESLQVARYRGNIGTDNVHVKDVLHFRDAIKQNKTMQDIINRFRP
jgi:hypothetical protein